LFLGVWIGLKGASLNLDIIAKTTPEGKSVLSVGRTSSSLQPVKKSVRQII
jgi:hypothetical protein